ncbi:hypothetical protein NKG05_09110 [Oerskovia sp. M15]
MGAGRPQETSAAWSDVVYAQGEVGIASIATATEVAVGADFSCVVADGDVWCTGTTRSGSSARVTRRRRTCSSGPS